ncbi:MAG: DUF3443 family protein [Burkholderiaceae bacterium]|nr:DUF3443 family protein [Burkholderiaceae bacterium]
MSIDSRSLRLALFASAAALAASGCGGGGSSSASSSPSPPPPSAGNVTAMAVDGGPTVGGSINQSYVTVTVCVPGSNTCQQIDHVWVDTGSTGLRIFSSVLTLSLPAVQLSSNTVANCIQFVSSAYAWGAVRTADVKISGEAASSVPIQVIADSAVPSTAPSDCSNGGKTLNTPLLMGANGLLGIGVFQQDCGLGCQVNTPPPTGFYYTCPGGGTCAAVNIATTSQVQNVVGMFATDNNGTLIQLQALPGGSLSTAVGSLIFGINTQSNNQLGSAVVFSADPGLTANFRAGDIQTTYGGVTDPASYIDSGSNLWFFNDASITQCMSGGKPTGLYCPTSPLSLQATMLPYDTPTNAASFTYTFNVVDISNAPDAAFNNAGGPAGAIGPGGATFDWGLPFFYGRNVYTGLEGKTIGGHNGPFFAASTP